MKFIIPAFFLLAFQTAAFSQQPGRFTVSGFITEKSSGESLIGVNIYVPAHKAGTVSNNYGFYSITMPPGDSVDIYFSYVGFSTARMKVKPAGDIELNVRLEANILLGEVEITASRTEKLSESARMSNLSIRPAEISSVPALLGEKDVLKTIQLMPGVQKGTEGTSGIYVRGGGPDQNLIILDDAIVYNASHLFGFFSLFNGDALKSVEFTKGGFPARYGGRLSSVIEMTMKEGNKEEWKGEGGIGLISSRLTLEGPVIKGKSSILLSARRTYADLIMRPVLKSLDEQNTGYYFYDLNAKVNYDFGRKNKIYLSGYFGNDKFYLKQDRDDVIENAGFRWGNSTATFRWNHLYSSRLFSNASLVYSNYNFGIYEEYKVVREEKDYYAEFFSGISDATIKYDFDFIPGPQHWIKTGVVAIAHKFSPHAFVEVDYVHNLKMREKVSSRGVETGFYIEDTWQPGIPLKINAGLRFTHFLAGEKQYFNPEPRISAAWRLKDNTAVKGSFSSMNQYIHLVSNTGISLPTDLWVPATERVAPQRSSQVALGLVRDLQSRSISLSAEGYYKIMQNVIGYKEGASFMEFDEAESGLSINWEDNVTSGKAWSYGIELLARKNEGSLTGWIGYTLSWTLMQFDSLNSGRKFYARYDRRNDVSVVAMWKPRNNIELSATWVYGSGNAVSLPLSQYTAQAHYPANYNSRFNPIPVGSLMPFGSGEVVNDFGQKNNFRMGAYHRFDIGIRFPKQKEWGVRTWEFSVYNVYNHRNPFYYYIDQVMVNNKAYGRLMQVSLFPVIPSITYSFSF